MRGTASCSPCTFPELAKGIWQETPCKQHLAWRERRCGHCSRLAVPAPTASPSADAGNRVAGAVSTCVLGVTTAPLWGQPTASQMGPHLPLLVRRPRVLGATWVSPITPLSPSRSGPLEGLWRGCPSVNGSALLLLGPPWSDTPSGALRHCCWQSALRQPRPASLPARLAEVFSGFPIPRQSRRVVKNKRRCSGRRRGAAVPLAAAGLPANALFAP